jgi:hypothetical protein
VNQPVNKDLEPQYIQPRFFLKRDETFMKRNNWMPEVVIIAEPIPDFRFNKIIAELGEVIYREFCSCQLQTDQSASPIATSAFDGVLTKRTAANE